MKQFHYTAVDPQGHLVSGSVEAVDWPSAVEVLMARGLTDCRETSESNLPALSAADAVELAGYLAELSKSGLPLGGTLRALAKDAASPALRRVIDELIRRLESGQSLELALESLGGSLPDHIRRLMVTAARGGRLSGALERLLDHEQRLDDMGRRLRQAVAYPLLLLGLLFVWVLFVTIEVVPQLLSVLTGPGHDEFSLSNVSGMDRATLWLMIVANWVPWLLCGALAAIALTSVIVWAVGGSAALSRLLSLVPIVGPVWRDRGLADFSGLLSEFVDAQLTLPEALELTASGARDPALRIAAIKASAQTREGTSLAPALHFQGPFTDTMTQWSSWGEQRGALPDAMRAAARMFAERFELRLQFLKTVLPAIVFTLIAASAVLVAAGVFKVLFTFIASVSWEPSAPPAGPTVSPIVVASVLIGAFVAGMALLLLARLIHTRDDVTEAVAIVARYVGSALVAGSLLVVSVMTSWLGFLAWLLLMGAWLRGAWRYRQMQKQSLWTTLSLAAEHRTPLAPMALAFADEHSGTVAYGARRLARQLAAGADLAEALAWSKGALPADAPLAIRIGTDTGDLFGALRASRGKSGTGRPLMPPPVVWLLLFFPAAVLVVSFMQLKIFPSFVQIFEDFDMSLPPLTILMLHVTNWAWLPFVGIALAAVAVLVWLQWRGTLQPRLPGLKRIARWVELAPLLRILSLVTERGQPLSPALESMARLHSRGWVRRRLQRAVRDLQTGSTWQESLRRRQLLNDGELALLASAQRNGNLPWALAELGDSMQRRADFRLKAFGEFALPVLLMFVGLVVGLIVVAYFLPLVKIVNDLA